MKFLRDIIRKHSDKKNLSGLHAEILKNLESYYVMSQLNKLRSFKIDCWEKIQHNTNIEFDDAIKHYITAITNYNSAFAEFTEYDQWYSADINNRSKDTGKILHAKKEAAQQKFVGLEEIIKSAQECVKKQL